MAWWKGIDETRLLVAPDPAGNETGSGCLLSLRHPKSGNKACYRLASGGLQELHLFKQSYRSWFLGDYVCEDGGIYFATSVDPVFILLPIFEEARMKKGDDLGKFRPLDEIIFIDGYPGYHQLMSIAENCMGVVCEIKAIGSSKFFRLDDSKVLAWLHCKVSQLKQTFPSLDEKYASMDEQTTCNYQIQLIPLLILLIDVSLSSLFRCSIFQVIHISVFLWHLLDIDKIYHYVGNVFRPFFWFWIYLHKRGGVGLFHFA
ncbi:unnamed protein product [Linum tenue]|uniref:Ribonuclease H2 subunit B n=1 Tax=Linum tenue TaxID=586396 RepID=A0AAV0IC97_9ROSI|nr:unnamed protein product [Linum tenue]